MQVPHAECKGFGDRESYSTKSNMSAIMKVCDEKKDVCKAFSYSPDDETPRSVFMKDSFGLPQVSSYNFYIKKKWLLQYLKGLFRNTVVCD